jgi:hypothetical protein
MRVIADQIRQHLAANEKREYAIYFVPRRTMICEEIFKEENLPLGKPSPSPSPSCSRSSSSSSSRSSSSSSSSPCSRSRSRTPSSHL